MTVAPVSSLLTSCADGVVIPAGPVELRGIAWGGHGGIAAIQRVRLLVEA